MKIKNSSFRWIIDVILFAGFISCFFYDQTGLATHQWLGVFAAIFALYHLGIHWGWVKAVAARFLSKTPARSRLFLAVDVALFAGFVSIILSGLVISTWLNLSLPTVQNWILAHVTLSIITAFLVLLKIGLHWRWISATWRKFFVKRPLEILVPGAQPSALSRPAMNRREFLRVIVPATAVTIAATGVVIKGFNLFDLENPTTGVAQADSALPGDLQTRYASASSPESAVSSNATPLPDLAVEAQTATPVPLASASTTCMLRCPNRCSFPGRCRRYTDSNNNNRCDWGECL